MDTSRVGGVDVVHPKIWIIEVGLHRIAELRLDIWADVGAMEVARRRAAVEHGRGRGQDIAQALFGLRQRGGALVDHALELLVGLLQLAIAQ